MDDIRISSGLDSLDQLLDGFRLGDNVVWQIDNIEDYRYFANIFLVKALNSHKRVVYLRFSEHSPIINHLHDNKFYGEYKLDAGLGFETFSTQVQDIITREGEGVFYVYDSLSELLSEWSTDLMIGNFFAVTCPYLYQLNTIAFFAINRGRHSYQTIARIRETTQILLDLFNQDYLYIHPLKVWKRYSPTMFLPHVLNEDKQTFKPLTNSADIARLLNSNHKTGAMERKLDYWDQFFIKAAKISEEAHSGQPEAQRQVQAVLAQLIRMLLGRDEKLIALAEKYFTIDDLLTIKSRLIGSGFIGGKAAGLLLSRAILAQDQETDWNTILEPHDSFYIGSDVFYTYLVENGCWQWRLEQKKPENYFSTAVILKEKILSGRIPEFIREQFLEMLEYFGQAPIIIRSSSLLEDGFGNTFAGKYESIFCVNQGNLSDRYECLIQAIRQVYASTMNEDALAYRLHRGLAQKDEQMALLVQRVSGGYHNSYFFPDLAGVGLSRNLYVWKPNIDPSAGMLRLVLGLGTRAVNRTGDDYARFVALDQPLLSTATTPAEQKTFSQHSIDLLSLEQNSLATISLEKLAEQKELIPDLTMFTTEDSSVFKVCDFKNLLSRIDFPETMRKILHTLQTAYNHPVDTEFTCNFCSKTKFLINLLQCRPLQVNTNQQRIIIPSSIPTNQIIFKTIGKTMGGSLKLRIKRIIYIDPHNYAALNQSAKYTVARLIGKINQLITSQIVEPTVLLGPGRWGTSTPSLGVPVNFSEINKIKVLGELTFTTGGFIPELSYGTHFFQNMMENELFYLIISDSDSEAVFNYSFFKESPNQLGNLIENSEQWQSVIRVINDNDISGNILLYADAVRQRTLCWIETSS